MTLLISVKLYRIGLAISSLTFVTCNFVCIGPSMPREKINSGVSPNVLPIEVPGIAR